MTIKKISTVTVTPQSKATGAALADPQDDEPPVNKMRSGTFLVAVAVVAMTAIFFHASWSLYAARTTALPWELSGRADHAVKMLEKPLRTQDHAAIERFKDMCRQDGITCFIFKCDEKAAICGDVPGWGATRTCGDYEIGLRVNGIMRSMSFFGWIALELLALLIAIVGLVRLRRATRQVGEQAGALPGSPRPRCRAA